MTIATPLHTESTVGTWKLDPAHSELSFTVRHLAISKVRGFFRSFDVTIEATERLADSTITATIDMASIDTNNEMRDGHLKTNDFFLIEEHPTATYVSRSITGTPEEFTVTGDLTLRGVTKEVILRGEFGGMNRGGDGALHAAATVRGKLNRLDFDLQVVLQD